MQQITLTRTWDNRNIDLPVRRGAGFELRASLPAAGCKTISPGASARIPTGWIWHIPMGYIGRVYIDPNLALDKRIGLAEQVMLVEPDAPRQELCLELRNNWARFCTVMHGARIARLIVEAVAPVELVDRMGDVQLPPAGMAYLEELKRRAEQAEG